MKADKILEDLEEAEAEIVTLVDIVILEARNDHLDEAVYEAEEAQHTVNVAIEVPVGKELKM